MSATLPALWHSSAAGSTYEHALRHLAAADRSLALSIGKAVGDEMHTLEALRRGELAGAVVTSVPLSSLDARFAVADLPYVLSSPAGMRSFWSHARGRELLNVLPAQGVRPVAVLDGGLRHFFSSATPIRSPDDLVGKRFRILPSAYHSYWLASMGAHPVSIPPTQFQTALTADAVDGAERSLSNIVEYDLSSVARHVSLTSHLVASAFVVLSEQWWRGLSKRSQVALIDAADHVGHDQPKRYQARDDEAEDVLRNVGTEIVHPDLGRFEVAAHNVHQFFADRVPGGAALLARAIEGNQA